MTTGAGKMIWKGFAVTLIVLLSEVQHLQEEVCRKRQPRRKIWGAGEDLSGRHQSHSVPKIAMGIKTNKRGSGESRDEKKLMLFQINARSPSECLEQGGKKRIFKGRNKKRGREIKHFGRRKEEGMLEYSKEDKKKNWTEKRKTILCAYIRVAVVHSSLRGKTRSSLMKKRSYLRERGNEKTRRRIRSRGGESFLGIEGEKEKAKRTGKKAGASIRDGEKSGRIGGTKTIKVGGGIATKA